jgi:hypothetical protein
VTVILSGELSDELRVLRGWTRGSRQKIGRFLAQSRIARK